LLLLITHKKNSSADKLNLIPIYDNNELSKEFWNLILGWVALLPLLTYSLTVEPTMSFWDCGEYIATAQIKLVIT
jgi:hypothetical protein